MSGKIEKNEYPKASNRLVFAAILTYIALLGLLLSFCSPYWIEAYPGFPGGFKNMGLWEYCFDEFTYPNYQLMKKFDGCHNIFGQEYYVIREYLVPGWLMAVQTFVTLAFILTIIAMIVMTLELIRWPLTIVLRYEWMMTFASFVCCSISTVCLFLGVVIFGGCAYRRDWLMYPKFNVLSWAYALAVVAFMILGLSSLVLMKEAKQAYEARSEAKNLVMQMEMHEQSSNPSSRHFSRSPTGYI